MRKIKLILQITFAVMFCTACSTSISETPEVSMSVCANDALNMSSFLNITLGKTTDAEIEGILGDAYIPWEPLLTEWTWSYLCDTGDEIEGAREDFYITFDTTETPNIVSKLNYHNPQIDIAELIDLFGSPELVYKETVRDRSEEYTKYTFAYPSIGIFGSTISTSTPIGSDYVNEIVKEPPQDLRDYITSLESEKEVEFIEWSYK